MPRQAKAPLRLARPSGGVPAHAVATRGVTSRVDHGDGRQVNAATQTSSA